MDGSGGRRRDVGRIQGLRGGATGEAGFRVGTAGASPEDRGQVRAGGSALGGGGVVQRWRVRRGGGAVRRRHAGRGEVWAGGGTLGGEEVRVGGGALGGARRRGWERLGIEENVGCRGGRSEERRVGKECRN